MPPLIISYLKVSRALLALEANNAYGPDGILARFLKEFADELVPVLCRLFRLILTTSNYPSPWKHALAQPILKKSDRLNPSNYRLIALTSTIAKVFESLLNAHFLKYLESNSLLSDHQYGVRKARSTGDLLSYLTHVWSTSFRDFGNLMSSLLISLRHLAESVIRLCWPNSHNFISPPLYLTNCFLSL